MRDSNILYLHDGDTPMTPICVFRSSGLVELEDLYDSDETETISLSEFQKDLINTLLWTIGAGAIDPKEVLKKIQFWEQTAKDFGAYPKDGADA